MITMIFRIIDRTNNQVKYMKNVLEYLEKTAKKLPDKMAVTDGEISCTFSELKSISSRIGRILSEYISPSDPVAVMMKKSTRTLQIFLGTVYAGGFYCLLEPDFPDERHISQIKTLCPTVIITEPERSEKLKRLGYTGKVITTDELYDRVRYSEELSDIPDTGDTAPLYCNFTSGSTGVPKGVLVGHASVISFIDTFTELFNIQENDVIGNQAPFDFDVSVKDIYSSLKTGATLVIIPTACFRFPNSVMDMLEKYEVTTLIWAVSALVLLNRLHEFMYKIPPHINKVLFSGEEMPSKHLADWMAVYPDATFVNLYGPTEITCNCAYYVVNSKTHKEAGDIYNGDIPEKLPVGYVYPGKEIYLIDDKGNIIPETEEKTVGEIIVAGSELALGYYNNKEATDKAFVQIEGIGRVYKTGDLGYRASGLLYFAGRRDFQIKHNGHRIELEEIERAMNSLSGIGQACCIFDNVKYRIIAYYTSDTAIDRKEIVAGLKEKLPEYMLPNIYKCLEELPLTKNGKIDRNKLRKTL